MRRTLPTLAAVAAALTAAEANTMQPDTPPMHTNRLSDASSPYLLQHAHNPVDWWPWCDEAFDEARRRDVPVFLSIGYSTCYWCHVMERESFEDEEIARRLRDGFVAVKVDREEHPAVDDLYMAATQVSTGGGGWPMSVFLEPDTRRPFFCGTYFPPEPSHGRPSFSIVLGTIADAWTSRRDDVRKSATELADAVSQELAADARPVAVGEPQVSQAVSVLLRIHDETHGGFGRAPKFPQPSYAEFLLDARESADEATTSAIDHVVRRTLDAIMLGGIHDHIGGGFHRYAVDASWTVPHFEKMLYDNAALAGLYARAARVYGDDEYHRTARRAFEYVRREMTHASGVFYSAQDAEVDGREGLNYLWLPDQIDAVLSEDRAWLIKDVLGLDAGTNFQDPHHPGEPRRNVLRLSQRLTESARDRDQPLEAFLVELDDASRRLLEARDNRKAPRLDDKVIAAWNGMMIEALARASVDLDEPELFERASGAADELWKILVREDGSLRRTVRPGAPSRSDTPASLEDYAFFARGLTRLASAAREHGTDAQPFVDRAAAITDSALERFADPRLGGFYDTEASRGDLFFRATSLYDGAMESGSAAMTHVLLDLYQLTGEVFYRDRAASAIVAASAAIHRQPVSTVSSTGALLRAMRLGLPLAERWVALGLDAEPTLPETPVARPSPVRVFASEERVALTRNHPATLSIVVEVESPYHIVAARPTDEGDAGLIPFRVGVAGGTGVAVYADYPDGEPYTIDGVTQPIRVYKGRTEIDLAVEIAGEVTGRPVIVLGFQACNDTECLPPRNIELDVAIDTD